MGQENSKFDEYSNWYNKSYAKTFAKLSGYDKVRLDNAADYSFNRNVLSEYADTTFKVGDNKAFEVISNDLCDKVQTEEDKVNKYLEQAEEARAKILEYMDIDAQAKAAADQAYTDFMNNNKSDYEEERIATDSFGNAATYIYYDEAAHIAAAESKRDEVWRKENCPLWND